MKMNEKTEKTQTKTAQEFITEQEQLKQRIQKLEKQVKEKNQTSSENLELSKEELIKPKEKSEPSEKLNCECGAELTRKMERCPVCDVELDWSKV